MTRIRRPYLALKAVLRQAPLIIAALILTPYAANAQTVTVDAIDSGWYNPALGHSSGNKNYAAGPDDTYRNFFVFDLTGISGTIVGATLRLETDPNWINGTPNYEMYDVTTDIATLVSNFPAGATTDAIQNFTPPVGSDPADFIEPGTNEVRLLLQTIQTSGLPNVRTQLDQVLFNFE